MKWEVGEEGGREGGNGEGGRKEKGRWEERIDNSEVFVDSYLHSTVAPCSELTSCMYIYIHCT